MVMTLSAIESFLDLNPLRQYRTEHRINRTQLAIYLRVSTRTLSLWETAAVRPSRDAFVKLVQLMHDNDIEERWDEWLDKRPQL